MKTNIPVQQKLFALQDTKYLAFNHKLCPDTHRKMIGIRVPAIKKLAKEMLKVYSIDTILSSIEGQYFEEIQLQGLVIAYAKMPLQEKLPYLQMFISNVDSWAISDIVIPELKIKKEDLEMFWKFILSYVNSAKEFEVRVAVIAMLKYYLKEEYIDEVISILEQITHDGYYVKMAKAWTLAEIAIRFPEKGMAYLQSEHHLDTFTYQKTLQKMLESYRIPVEQKDRIRKMKRK